MIVLVPSTADATAGGGTAAGGSCFGSRGCAGAGAGPTSGVAEFEFAGAGRRGVNGILRSGGA